MEDPLCIIKEEPLEIAENTVVKSEPPDFALEPKVEVKTEDIVEEAEIEDNDETLSCPKCGIRYYSARSIKNHIQVCKKGVTNDLNANTSGGIGSVRVVIKGVKLLAEDERRSIRILEQSCFVNDIQIEHEELNDEVSVSHYCGECQVTFKGPSHYARHLYAHTFIKVEDADMPCICITCGQDFPDKYQLDKHLPESNCSGQAKFLFPCYLCSKIFTRKDNLRDDLRSHINAERRRAMMHKREYKCKKCSKEYGGQTILNIHQLSHRKRVIKSSSSENPKKRKLEEVKVKEEEGEPFTEIKIKTEPLE